MVDIVVDNIDPLAALTKLRVMRIVIPWVPPSEVRVDEASPDLALPGGHHLLWSQQQPAVDI